jgi:hypothetical protein
MPPAFGVAWPRGIETLSRDIRQETMNTTQLPLSSNTRYPPNEPTLRLLGINHNHPLEYSPRFEHAHTHIVQPCRQPRRRSKIAPQSSAPSSTNSKNDSPTQQPPNPDNIYYPKMVLPQPNPHANNAASSRAKPQI